MPKSYNRYVKLWERYWANGNYPMNGELSKQDRISIKRIYLKLNANRAIRLYRAYVAKTLAGTL